MYIIGTVGPNISDKSVLKGIIQSGVNVLRFNFSHGNEQEFAGILKNAREIKEDIEVIVDLSGSKVRISDNFEYIYKIYDNEEIYFCGEDKYEKIKTNVGNFKNKVIPLNIKNRILYEGNHNRISIKDDTMIFKVKIKENEMIKAVTIKGGIVRKGKGCNIKDLNRDSFSLNEKDKKAIIWGLNHEIDIICYSFVENEKNIKEVKEFIDSNVNGKHRPRIWAKLETVKGINNTDAILKEVDGIVIGRGDLIPETSIEDTPIYEEKIISKVIKSEKKDLIIATHILNNMKIGKMPSISEVESVYGFIKLGVTGFLLAGETSIGKAPIKTVQFLKSLIDKYKIF